MSRFDNIRPMSLLSGALGLLAGLVATVSQASIVEISAVFFPDPANPHIIEFKNTTANSGLCNTFPSFCQLHGLYSIRLGLEALTTKPILANHTDIRQGAMIKVPADARQVQVTSSTGKTAELTFAITAFSGTHRTRDVRELTGKVPGSNTNIANNALWKGGSWGFYTPAPCTRGAGMNATGIDADYFWLTPEAASCGKSPAFDIDSLRLRNASISYSMKTPDPLKMEGDTYRGSITYTVGPGGDFDFGDVLQPTATSVTLNFTLKVQHTLKVQFPAGSDRLSLNPEGGWQQWLNRGQRPEKLFADQDFKQWSSTAFIMKLQCEHRVGTHCAIQNPAGHTVAVDTRVTLPSGLRDAANRPVNRYALSTEPTVFTPSYYVDNGRAALHFEVPRDEVAGMINGHSGTQYTGNVTVIWDSSFAMDNPI